MTDTTTIVDTYIAMWNETDPDRRRALIEQAWADGASYVDPLLEADGYDGLSAMVDGVHELYPGHQFRRTSGVDVHHDQIRFGWELVAPDGALTVAGIDMAALATDGRLLRIAGFFGELPAVDAAAA
jgi:hypothetical protein